VGSPRSEPSGAWVEKTGDDPKEKPQYNRLVHKKKIQVEWAGRNEIRQPHLKEGQKKWYCINTAKRKMALPSNTGGQAESSSGKRKTIKDSEGDRKAGEKGILYPNL